MGFVVINVVVRSVVLILTHSSGQPRLSGSSSSNSKHSTGQGGVVCLVVVVEVDVLIVVEGEVVFKAVVSKQSFGHPEGC